MHVQRLLELFSSSLLLAVARVMWVSEQGTTPWRRLYHAAHGRARPSAYGSTIGHSVMAHMYR